MLGLIPRRRLIIALGLAILVASVLSVRLSRPMLETDEITYMSKVLESAIQGTALPVHGDGSLFTNKPPLALWLMRASFEVMGPGPLAARLHSVLAGTATAVVLYFFGAAVFGEAAGILAALIFALTPGLLMLHGLRGATTDALEILLIASAIVGLEIWRRRRRPWALACLVICVSASAWVKSPFGLVVFVVYCLVTELPARRAGRGTPRFGVTLALAAGVWLGAYLLWLGTISAASSTRTVTRKLWFQQYVKRVEGRVSKAHVQNPGYYLTSVASDFGPLLLLPVGAAVAGWLASRKGRQLASNLSRHDVACLAVWSLAAPVLATASASKLPWYAYLSYPGIALLLAVSARHLAQSISERRSVQAALGAAVVLVLVWRLPMDRIWPAEAGYRGPTGKLWESTRRDRIAIAFGPGFQFPLQRGDAYREARLYLRILFWEQSQNPAGPGSCRAVLVNRRRDGAPQGGEALALHRPTRRGVGIFLADHCGGTLRERLTRR